jgi:hypothetical protein
LDDHCDLCDTPQERLAALRVPIKPINNEDWVTRCYRCTDEPGWPQREQRERLEQMMAAAEEAKQAERDRLEALRATAIAQAAGEHVDSPIDRARLQPCNASELLHIAEGMGVRLTPKARLHVWVAEILAALPPG